MPPEGPFIVAIVAIVFGTVFLTIKAILNYLQHRNSGGEGSSLTSGELEALIERAVASATRPLEERMDRIEQQTRPMLNAANEPLLFEEEEADLIREPRRTRK